MLYVESSGPMLAHVSDKPLSLPLWLLCNQGEHKKAIRGTKLGRSGSPRYNVKKSAAGVTNTKFVTLCQWHCHFIQFLPSKTGELSRSIATASILCRIKTSGEKHHLSRIQSDKFIVYYCRGTALSLSLCSKPNSLFHPFSCDRRQIA